MLPHRFIAYETFVQFDLLKPPPRLWCPRIHPAAIDPKDLKDCEFDQKKCNPFESLVSCPFQNQENEPNKIYSIVEHGDFFREGYRERDEHTRMGNEIRTYTIFSTDSPTACTSS
jgi:hypothetical protein